jgi:hypothetical protein
LMTANMLFMVIEHFKDPGLVKARFADRGRMLPDDVQYIDSWITTDGLSCYQIMRAATSALLAEWTKHWEDIVDFEIIPVLTSAEFNSTRT